MKTMFRGCVLGRRPAGLFVTNTFTQIARKNCLLIKHMGECVFLFFPGYPIFGLFYGKPQGKTTFCGGAINKTTPCQLCCFLLMSCSSSHVTIIWESAQNIQVARVSYIYIYSDLLIYVFIYFFRGNSCLDGFAAKPKGNQPFCGNILRCRNPMIYKSGHPPPAFSCCR